MKKLIDFPDVIVKKIEDARQREGHKTFTAALNSIVSAYYDKKYFDKRRVDVVKPLGVIDLTPEQECEKYGGKVVEMNGIRVCRMPTVGESAALVPLSAHKDFKKYHKP